MQKVITINLNGVAYQIEESGYNALVTYLDAAQRQLAANPDRAEIVADLELAIAEKCGRFLSPHKTVVTAPEVAQIIAEMGPVESQDDAGAGRSAAAPEPGGSGSARPRKRLYRIREGAIWEGVCSGLAAYTGIHVALVRIAFVLLVVWTIGLGLLVYWILVASIPEAFTADERAAAHGQAPFNAQDLIDRAKQQYASFAGDHGWRRRWRREQRAWRRQRRAAYWAGGWTADPRYPAVTAPAAYGTRLITGLMVPVLSLASILFFGLWAVTIVSLVTRGHVFGQPLPDNVPLWMVILGLAFVYHAIAWPLRFARRRAAYYSFGGYGLLGAWDGLM